MYGTVAEQRNRGERKATDCLMSAVDSIHGKGRKKVHN